jgi:hypothetical protein
MAHPGNSSGSGAAPWLHLLLLVGLISLLAVGRRMVSTEDVLTYSLIARSVYTWMPALAGIAISVSGPQSRCTRVGLLVSFVAIALMLLLDVTGTAPVDESGAIALLPDASIANTSRASQAASLSWVRTIAAWIGGDMPGVTEMSGTYDVSHPRARVAIAIIESGLVLMVIASVGFVIAAMSWVRAHVVFKREQDARAFYVVLSWLIAPMVVGLTQQFASEQSFRVLFRGAALWRPLMPSVLAFAVGIWVWWYTGRYRDAGDA